MNCKRNMGANYKIQNNIGHPNQQIKNSIDLECREMKIQQYFTQ